MKTIFIILILIFAAGFTYGIIHTTSIFNIALCTAMVVGLIYLGFKILKND